MKYINCDVAVIGAGGAGLSAAAAAAETGRKTAVIDRETNCGGVLCQCIHNGFGLRFFNEELTGPEYAGRMERLAREAGAEIFPGETVNCVKRNSDGTFEATLFSAENGVTKLNANAVVFATGCRERTRANIAVPGERCAGVYTAGAAQKLMNLNGMLPGRRAVIIGSGDIGLIMARRCRWSGIDVAAVVEIQPEPSGLPRNIAQCLRDFDIPLLLSHRCTRIMGRNRVEGVEIENMITGEHFTFQCDTVLFSVGLIPENELLKSMGVTVNPATGGPCVDDCCQCAPGIFAAGNSLHVHDLVDFASLEARRAGTAAAVYASGGTIPQAEVTVGCGKTLKYVIPNKCTPGKSCEFFFRPTISCAKAKLTAAADGKEILRKLCVSVRPAEMLAVKTEVPAGIREIMFQLEECK
jgi:NADPH-dependent 2,4-dienoyl-CoA reductase/sulfur reductase-like enzyme